jgi:hypothetical protein
MVYKKGKKLKVDGELFDYQIVEAELPEGAAEDAESELDQALSDGWFRTPAEALEGVPTDDEAPTREELEAKAAELGIEFTDGTRDKTLVKKIAEALAAQED